MMETKVVETKNDSFAFRRKFAYASSPKLTQQFEKLCRPVTLAGL